MNTYPASRATGRGAALGADLDAYVDPADLHRAARGNHLPGHDANFFPAVPWPVGDFVCCHPVFNTAPRLLVIAQFPVCVRSGHFVWDNCP